MIIYNLILKWFIIWNFATSKLVSKDIGEKELTQNYYLFIVIYPAQSNWMSFLSITLLLSIFRFIINLVEIKELELALKIERTIKIKLLLKLLFDSKGYWSKRERMNVFGFQTASAEFSDKVIKLQVDFPLTDFITIWNLHSIFYEGLWLMLQPE